MSEPTSQYMGWDIYPVQTGWSATRPMEPFTEVLLASTYRHIIRQIEEYWQGTKLSAGGNE